MQAAEHCVLQRHRVPGVHGDDGIGADLMAYRRHRLEVLEYMVGFDRVAMGEGTAGGFPSFRPNFGLSAQSEVSRLSGTNFDS